MELPHTQGKNHHDSQQQHTQSPVIGQAEAQAIFKQMVQHQIRQAIRATFIAILEEKVAAFIGAQPYERPTSGMTSVPGIVRARLARPLG